MLSEAINENDNSSKTIKLLHKIFFVSPSKIGRSERISKKKKMIDKYVKHEDRRNKKTTEKPVCNGNTNFDEEDKKCLFARHLLSRKRTLTNR